MVTKANAANDNELPWWCTGFELDVELHYNRDTDVAEAVSIVTRYCNAGEQFELRDISAAFTNCGDVDGLAYNLTFSVTFEGELTLAMLNAVEAIGVTRGDMSGWIASAARALAHVSDDATYYDITTLPAKIPDSLSIAVERSENVGGKNV